MKLCFTLSIFFCFLFSCTNSNESRFNKGNIEHTVQFNLKHEPGSLQSQKFLDDGQRILSALPTVRNFKVLEQIGSKNNYKYYFTMIFDNQKDYDAYNTHPEHVKFVQERWEKEVIDFLEADFVVID